MATPGRDKIIPVKIPTNPKNRISNSLQIPPNEVAYLFNLRPGRFQPSATDPANIRRLSKIRFLLTDLGLNYTATYRDEEVTRERIAGGRCFVLERADGGIVGTVLFSVKNYFTGRRSAYVSQLAIHPSLKRSGLGTVMMDLCEDLAGQEGFEAVQLDTAKPAAHLVSWYSGRGYKIVGETRWEGKTYETWIFEKPISDSAADKTFDSDAESG
jgi:ribosomal protein S18 acetylase RimI-like enzyme